MKMSHYFTATVMMEWLGLMFCPEEFSGGYLSELQIFLKVYGLLILYGKTELFYSR